MSCHELDLREQRDPQTDDSVLDRYSRVRAFTEALARPLSGEDQTVQSMPDVSPTKWHRAHTTWFFEQFVLVPHGHLYRRMDERFAYLFNSYYEGAGRRHPRAERGLLSRPGIGEVAAYRQTVDEAMASLLGDEPSPSLIALVELGLQHEQQHQELLLMDIKHVLSVNPLRPAYRSDPRAGGGRSTTAQDRSKGESFRWLRHPGGLVEVGYERLLRTDSDRGFAFDNELPRHRVWLEEFALADRLVTAGDWLAFIDDGGYQHANLWLSDGWAVNQAEDRRAPLYWDETPDGWELFTLAGRQALDPRDPVVHVSYFEADAFARWAGARLPTESEWEASADCSLTNAVQDTPFQLHPRRPTSAPAENCAGQLFGEVWQWTSSAYLPYPGFHPLEGIVGEYNGKFMVSQQVLRGSACITPPGHSRVSYRNFYPPAARWQFAGVRLAKDV